MGLSDGVMHMLTPWMQVQSHEAQAAAWNALSLVQ